MKVRKPTASDIKKVKEILTQWTDDVEVEKYIERINNEIDGIIEFSTHFFVLDDETQVVGIGGISDPLPKVLHFSKGNNPVEIKILYLDNAQRGNGYGKILLQSLEEQCKKDLHDEIIVRSAARYKDTAYGFYEKMDYNLVGTVDGDMAVFQKMLI